MVLDDEPEARTTFLPLYRLPSTSRAYPMPLLQKAQIWRAFFKSQGLLD